MYLMSVILSDQTQDPHFHIVTYPEQETSLE